MLTEEELLAMLLTDPEAAADALDRLGDELKERAALIRKEHRDGQGGEASSGGMGDRVLTRLVGPDGMPKQHTDTARRWEGK